MGGFQKGEKMTCEDCIYFKEYRGTRDRYGLQLEPDDYECVGNVTDRDLDRYFTNAESWDNEEDACSGFRSRHKEEWE